MSLELIKQLREQTGCGMVDCQKALAEANGDAVKALENLRKSGQAKAVKKEGRTTAEGLIGSYIHANNKVGALVEINCETDFVARNEAFRELMHDLAMQIVAASPKYVSREEVPADELAKEKEIYTEQLKQEGKPENILDKIIEGKVAKYYQDVCLLEQIFIRDDKMTVKDLVTQYIQKLGENIQVKRFVRFEI